MSDAHYMSGSNAPIGAIGPHARSLQRPRVWHNDANVLWAGFEASRTCERVVGLRLVLDAGGGRFGDGLAVGQVAQRLGRLGGLLAHDRAHQMGALVVVLGHVDDLSLLRQATEGGGERESGRRGWKGASGHAGGQGYACCVFSEFVGNGRLAVARTPECARRPCLSQSHGRLGSADRNRERRLDRDSA